MKCLYFHINPINNEIFYVGIGNEKRPFVKRRRGNHWNRIVKKYDYDILIEETNLTWKEACELEKYWIKRIGRRDLNEGTLINNTNGGEGFNGRKHSLETKLKIGLSQKGIPKSEESKLKMRLSHLGKIPWNKGLKK